MNERLKTLRKSLGLTQQEFADRLNISRNNIANYETTDRTPSDSTIGLICREFRISEDWLRYGKGPMEATISQEDELTEWAERMLSGRSSDFRRRFVRVLANLTEDEWEVIEQKMLEIVSERDPEQNEEQ